VEAINQKQLFPRKGYYHESDELSMVKIVNVTKMMTTVKSVKLREKRGMVKRVRLSSETE
jgi:hypothetical protein